MKKRMMGSFAGVLIALGAASSASGSDRTVVATDNKDWQNALVPHFQQAPQHDILGLKIGMTVQEAYDVLAPQGFQKPRYGLERTDRGRGAARFFKSERPRNDSRPAYERVTVYVDGSSAPRIIAVYRDSQYRRGAYPAFNSVIGALRTRFGAAPIEQRRHNAVLMSWDSGLPAKCRSEKTTFRYLRMPQDMSWWEAENCYYGMAVEVEYDTNTPGRPVDTTRSYLVDSRLIQANWEQSQALAREVTPRRAREAREQLDQNPVAEF